MKKTLMTLALPLVCLAAANSFAADTMSSGAGKTRADVKADARAAGPDAMGKENEASGAMAADSKTMSGDKSRAQVKAETKNAARSGELPKQGEAVAAEQGDGTSSMAGKTATKPKKHRMMHHKAAAESAGTDGAMGTAASPASGPVSAETKKPTN